MHPGTRAPHPHCSRLHLQHAEPLGSAAHSNYVTKTEVLELVSEYNAAVAASSDLAWTQVSTPRLSLTCTPRLSRQERCPASQNASEPERSQRVPAVVHHPCSQDLLRKAARLVGDKALVGEGKPARKHKAKTLNSMAAQARLKGKTGEAQALINQALVAAVRSLQAGTTQDMAAV